MLTCFSPQVNCVASVCGFGGMESSVSQPWLTSAPGQWLRLALSPLLHQGAIHVAMVTIAQVTLMAQVERTAGWLRVLVIYLPSSMAAVLVSGRELAWALHYNFCSRLNFMKEIQIKLIK